MASYSDVRYRALQDDRPQHTAEETKEAHLNHEHLSSPASEHDDGLGEGKPEHYWSRASSFLEDWWFWELLGLLLSAGALAAIVGLLAHYDNRPQPLWRHVSLNTVVSWLATVAKFMAMIPLTRGLGQLKWDWFASGERRLVDMRTFDSASRGPTGSVRLLLSHGGR